MINLRHIQKKQAEWQEKNFGNPNTNHMLMGISEELGELCHAELKAQQGIRNGEDHVENQMDAVGDIMIYLMGYCNSKGYDIENIIIDTWQQVGARDWAKNKENGNVG